MAEVKEKNKAELVVVISNIGYEQAVSDVARELNVSGGTFIGAHGLSKFEAEKFFNMVIESEKTICLFVVNAKRRNEVLKAFYEKVGLGTEAQGIVFSLPVEAMSENLRRQLFTDKKPDVAEPPKTAKATDSANEGNAKDSKKQ